MFYEIMHRESCVAQLSTTGECKICLEDFMPYDLVLVESDDFDERINNVTNFYYWCASRMLTLDRTYAKEILNSIGASQSVTDRERAQIALSYHCLSLLDVFWVKEENEKIRFEDINLFAHSLSNALVDIALRGHQKMCIRDSLNRVLDANIEGYRAIRDAGHTILPKEDADFEGEKYRKTCLRFFKLMCATSLGKLCASDHAMNLSLIHI